MIMTNNHLNRYGVALLAAVIALVFCLLLRDLISPHFLSVFLAAVIISAGYGGFTAGFVTLALSVILLGFFLLPPIYSLQVEPLEGTTLVQLTLFLFVSVIVLFVSEVNRRRQLRLLDERESKKRLQTILENMPVLLLANDPQPAPLVWNRECERVTGYSAQEMIGNPRALEIVYPDPQEYQKVLRLGREQRGNYRDVELVLTRKDGEKRVVSWSSISNEFPIADWASWSVGIDITQRKEIEETLRRNEIQARLINDNLPALISYIDSDLRYRFNNHMYEEWFGHKREDIFGKTMTEVLGEDAYEALKPYVEKALAGETVYFESIVPYKSVGQRFIDAAYVPDIDGNQQIRGFFVLVNDITDRKRAQERATILQHLTASLSTAITSKQVADAIVYTVFDALDVKTGSICVLTPDRQSMEIIGQKGLAEEIYQKYRIFPASSPGPLLDAIQGHQPVWLESAEDYIQRYPMFEQEIRRNQTKASAVIPFKAETELTGGITLSFDKTRKFSAEDRAFLVAVAQQCGQALERARLYEDERKAREQAERARGRMEYLAQASAILASSLDYQTTLTNVTRLATPSIADWCAVDLLNEEGKIERLAVAHVDPAKVEWAWELYRKSPPDMNAPRGLGKVIRTGESDFYPDIPDEVLVAAARDEENLKLLRDIGFRSAMTVPIQTHGRIFGALTLVNTKDSDRYFNEDDLALAEDLARRAATAIDNARLYEEAQAQREYWRVTLSSVGDAVIVTDETGKLTFLNDVASILTGWTLADALGKPLTEVFNIVNEHTRELVESPVEKVLREGVVVGLANHTVLISRDGHEVPIDDSGAPMRDEQGNLIGVVLVFRDITERKQIEMEREQVLEQERHARQEAERADQLKLKFLGMVSHELRTPLASIKGFASSLLAQDVNWEKDTERNFLSIIDSEADKLTGLVDQLLDLSRLQAGTMKIEAAPNSIYEIFETTMPQLQTLSQRHHLDIVLAPDLPRVMADPQRIGQVLSNLVSNAAKYAPQETPISINVKRIPDGIQVDVADQGPGIPEYAREYVFEAFRQVEERGRGAGLGLAICKAMVEGHGGRIWIDESYTDGAKISFTLPLAQ